MSARAISLVTLFSLAAAGCVDALEHEQLGRTSFLAGVSVRSADYDPLTTPPSAAAAGSGVAAAPSPGAAAPPTGPAPAAGRAAPPAGMAGAGAAAGSEGARASAPMAGAAGSGTPPGPAAGSGATTAPAGPSQGSLSINFTSVAPGGRYAPRNVGAVWIETGSGMFIKTIERWAGIRSNTLTRWTQASGGWGGFFGGGNTADMMDAMSGATLRMHKAHMLTWDMQDAAGKVVGDGSFRVVIEVADDEFTSSSSGEVEFMKGPTPQTIMAPDKTPWTGLVVTYQP